MTPGMQIRLWYARANRRQRQGVVAAVALVLALLATSVALRPDRHAGDAADGPAGLDGSPSTSNVADIPTGTDVLSGGGLPGSSLRAGSGVARGASATGTSAASRGATGSSGSGSIALTASDRGITPTSIKIGFLVANTSGLGEAGFAVGIRSDTPQYAQALADSVNRTGGVNGRKIEVAVRATDVTSQSDQAAACQAMINDHKVFGVVDVGSLSDTPAFECVAIQNRTPLIHNTIWGTDWLAKSGGLEVGFPAAIDRISKTWTRDLAAMKWFGERAVVGIVGDNCVATAPVIDNVLKPDFEKLPAVQRVVVAKHDCDLQSVVSQPPAFVTQFQTQNVTHVVLAVNFVSAAVFMSTADNQTFRPKYTISDWWQQSSDVTAVNYDPDQFDGAIGISSLGMNLPASGKAPYPGGERCAKAAQEAGLERMEYTGRNHELWAMCDNFFLMLAGIRDAGVNPTRPAWAQAIQRLGTYGSVLFGRSVFRQGKTTGSDDVHTIQWQRGCTCYKSISGFRPAAA